jgi:hypothetical protein
MMLCGRCLLRRTGSVVTIIDNGSDAPGTVLNDCSAEFRRRLAVADLIIAKGQGNYETLSDEPYNIFFLFKVKCQVIARHVGQPEGTQVLIQSGINKSVIPNRVVRKGKNRRLGRAHKNLLLDWNGKNILIVNPRESSCLITIV